MKIYRLVSLLVLAALGSFTPAVSGQSHSDNVVIVLDASGSMKTLMSGTGISRIEAAKRALKTVLEKLPQSTQVGLLVFSAANLRDEWVYPLGPRHDEILLPAIDLIQPNADTPLGKYLKKAADRLLEERAKQFGYGRYRMLVLTDGEAQDQALVDRYTPEIMARGIILDVIGVAMKQDHTLARKVHSYRRANDPEALARAVHEVFAEVSGTSDGASLTEAFDLLQAIPVETASAMIQALCNSGNQPIGSKPAAARPPTPNPVPTPSVAAPVATVPVPNAVQPAAPFVPPSQPLPHGPSPFGVPIAPVVILIVLAVVAKRLIGGRR